MARKFAVEIVTPEEKVFSGEAVSLIAPAERGYLGVLAGRAPLVCILRPGEVSIRTAGGNLHFAAGGGFMEVAPGKTTLLCDSVEEVSKIDLERARRALDRARRRLSSRDPAVNRGRAAAALDRARNRLRLASKYGKG